MFYVFKMKKVLGVMMLILGIVLVSAGYIFADGYPQDTFAQTIKVYSLRSSRLGKRTALSKKTIVCEKELRYTKINCQGPTYTIVIDAGHGQPDGGAVSESGICEEGINLSVAQILEEKLMELGYDVIMTRTTENNIADESEQTTIRKMKVSDINNRIKIANNSNADMLISIHMNKFSEGKYYGWQTFYKKGSEASKLLAEKVQQGISNNIDRVNKREVLPITNVKLIDKSEIPSIVVECGFLSNLEDLRLLQTDEYKEQLAEGILEGIENYYSGT